MYTENYDRIEKLRERFENEPILEEAGESHFKRRMPKDMSPWEKKYDEFMPKFTG